MFRILIFLLAVSAFFPSAAITNSANYIKVAGVVTDISHNGSKSLIINECDISKKSKRCIAELDSSGRFEITLPFYHGHTFTVNYKRRLFINAYAEPGDSIFVSIDASKSPIEFHLAGDNDKLNEEYSHAFNDLSPIYYDIVMAPDTVSLAEYMPQFKSEVARTRKIVDNYISEKKLMPETAELLHLDNIFIPANQTIGFRGMSHDEQMAFFTDTIFDITNEKNTKVMIFPYHLSALMNRSPEYVKKLPKSTVRDLMYASAEDAERPSKNDFENEAYYDRIYSDESSDIDYSNIKSGRMVVIEGDSVFNIENVNPVDWLIGRYPSRPVFVDVSATWCGPCRAGLAAGEDIRQHFKDSDVVFAVIWLKSDFDTWSTLAPTFHNATHFFVSDDDMANQIMSSLNVRGFPAYYLVDRKGKMSSDSIPHFNDPQLVDFLRAL